MLLDTDILNDLALCRHPRAQAAAELLDRIEHGTLTAFVAWHTVSNFYHPVSPARGRMDTRDFIVELTPFAAVVPTGTEVLRYTAALPMADFEDAMQVAAARACDARHIVTRNVKDYHRSPIPAIRPQDALREIS